MAAEELLQEMLPATQYDLSYMEMSEFFIPNITGDEKMAELLNGIKYFYDSNLFCDVKFVAGNIDHNFNSVSCHSLVLGNFH